MNNSNRTKDKVLYLLKTRGESTSAFLAKQLSLTSMGARQQLLKLSESGLITSYIKSQGVGRPGRFWHLTEKGQSRFPDRHADLTLDLLTSIDSIFGENALDKLISQREKESKERYQTRLKNEKTAQGKIEVLAQIRTEEGYMAEVEICGDHILLLENHCPICAAATQCQNFCRSELELFQELLADVATIERTEHQLKGARRCAYKVVPVKLLL